MQQKHLTFLVIPFLAIAYLLRPDICHGGNADTLSPDDHLILVSPNSTINIEQAAGESDMSLDLNVAKNNHWTNGITFNDWTKTVLLGSDKYPDVSGTLAPNGAQLMIVGRQTDSRGALMVVGNYRNGINGDRYNLTIGPDGDLTTNAYVLIWGTTPNPSVRDVSMLSISSDVQNGIVFPGGGYDVYAARHIKAYGATDKDGNTPEVFSLSGQGTLRIYNPYGQVGAVNYLKPQIILGDIGYDSHYPFWTYGYIQQQNGALTMGTYDPTTDSKGLNFRIHSDNTTDIVAAGAVQFKVDGQTGKTSVSSLSVGSTQHRTGITLYDQQTGDPYCLFISGGRIVTIPGQCH